MKKVFGVLIVLVTLSFGSCTTVDSGHAGVEVSWGGETNMNTQYIMKECQRDFIGFGMIWLSMMLEKRL